MRGEGREGGGELVVGWMVFVCSRMFCVCVVVLCMRERPSSFLGTHLEYGILKMRFDSRDTATSF